MKKDNDILCGKCEHFRIDDLVHNIGHCTINRMERFDEEIEEKCTFAKRTRLFLRREENEQ